LSDADPGVRAIAARLLHMGRVSAAASSLRQALATETDAGAALEMARALLVTGAQDANAAIIAAAARFSTRFLRDRDRARQRASDARGPW
jgi:hypothetical protein